MGENSDLFGKKHAMLWRFSMWANGLAPIVFFIYILFAFSEIFQYNQTAHIQHNTNLLGLFSQNSFYILDLLLHIAKEFIVGVVIYLILKGISLAFDIIVETDINYREKSAEVNTLETWETKLIRDANQPEFYNPVEVLKYKDKINGVFIVITGIYIFFDLLSFEYIRLLLQGKPLSPSGIDPLAVNIIATVITVGIDIAAIYFPLNILMRILKVLMEMEFNSRKAKA